MDSFAELINSASLEIDEMFSEQVEHYPKTSDAKDDPNRSRSTFTAILRFGSTSKRPLGKGWSMSTESSEITMTVLLAGKLESQLRTGDMLRAIDREHAPWFGISGVFARDTSSLICKLTRA